jgi:hypothetical protein
MTIAFSLGAVSGITGVDFEVFDLLGCSVGKTSLGASDVRPGHQTIRIGSIGQRVPVGLYVIEMKVRSLKGGQTRLIAASMLKKQCRKGE